MRTTIAILMVVGGLALMAISYLFLAAPLGTPSDPGFSNPRVPFAPSFFILGVMLLFLAAVAYELIPERGDG